jgi:hypothetical protein
MPHRELEARRRYQREYQRAYSKTHKRKRDWSKVQRSRQTPRLTIGDLHKPEYAHRCIKGFLSPVAADRCRRKAVVFPAHGGRWCAECWELAKPSYTGRSAEMRG